MAAREIKLEQIIVVTPFLTRYNIKMHFNQIGCKISGSIKTEQGFSKTKLKTNFGEKQFVQSSNFIQIELKIKSSYRKNSYFLLGF